MLKKYKSMLLILFTLLLVGCDSTEVELRFTVLKVNEYDGVIAYGSCDWTKKCGGGGAIAVSNSSISKSKSKTITKKRAYIYLGGDMDVRLEMFIENKNCGNYILEYKKGTIVDYTKSRLFIVECTQK